MTSKHKQIHPIRNRTFSNGAGIPLKPHSKRSALQWGRHKVFVGMSPKKSLRDLTGQAGSVKHANKGLVFAGMSGGVDSSVAAYLLKKQGYNVVGVFIRSYNLDGCAERDAEDARRGAEHLGIPFYVWNFEKEYKAKVVDYMIDGYRRGETPNPDVMCNKEIKFGLFFDRAMKLGADYVATGHYVKKATSHWGLGNKLKKTNSLNPIGYTLVSARDARKDQSYFLWTLTQKQISKSLFPIGDYLKPEVRKIAKKAGLPTADKKDSQGICFLGHVSMKDFLREYLPEKKGDVVNEAGEKIGEHMGAHFYTIGQRHLGSGFRFSGLANRGNDAGPMYVKEKDVKKNTLTVAEGSENPALYKKSAYLTDLNLNSKLEIGNLKLGFPVFARVRYRQPLFEAVLSKDKKGWRLDFKNPQKFVASGQSAVIYLPSEALAKEGENNNSMLGGGVIL